MPAQQQDVVPGADDIAMDDVDFDSLEISDFLEETEVSGAEELSNVMAASCTTCECCCSVSSLAV